MSTSRRVWTAVALAAIAMGSGASFGDPPKKPPDPPPDEDFLEFLGSVDSTADANGQPDDESWIEYLSQTDIDKAAKKAPAPVGSDAKPPKVKPDAQ